MNKPKRCTTCYSPLHNDHCNTCTRETLFRGGYAIGKALGFSPLARSICGALAASLPEILDAAKKSTPTTPIVPTQAEFDKQLKKLAPALFPHERAKA